jgi:hypothetical protein
MELAASVENLVSSACNCGAVESRIQAGERRCGLTSRPFLGAARLRHLVSGYPENCARMNRSIRTALSLISVRRAAFHASSRS